MDQGYGRQRVGLPSMSHCAPLLPLCVLLLTVPILVSGTTYVIGTSYNQPTPSYYMCSLYASGLQAPVRAASGNGVSFTASTSLLSATYTAADALGPNNDFASSGAVALYGFAGTFMFGHLYGWVAAYRTNIVMFGPYSESVDKSPGYFFAGYYASYWPGIYWTIAMDGAQSLALLQYLSKRPLFARKQLTMIQTSVTAQGSGPTDYGVGLSAGLLFALEMPKLGVTCTTVATTSGYSSAMSSKPGVVYMFGQYMGGPSYTVGVTNSVTDYWMSHLVSDSTLIAANSTVAATWYLQYGMMTAYQSAMSGNGKMLPPENVMFSSPTPGVDATEYRLTQDFLSAVTSFPGCSNNMCKNIVLAGWMSATALMHAVSMYGGPSTITYTTVYDNLLSAQSSFLVSDLFLGSFGPSGSECTSVAASQGAICKCNQAGLNIFFARLTSVGATVDVVTIPGALFQYAKDQCASVIPPGDLTPVVTPYTDLFTFSMTKQLVGFSPTDNAMMSEMCNAVSAVSSVLSDRLLYRHLAPNGYAVGCISTTVAGTGTALSSHMNEYVTTSLTGVIPDAVISSIPTPSTFVLDFMPQTTQPQVMQSNLVYLFPTLDQELYVLASYLHGVVTASSVVCGVVLKSNVSPAIVTLLGKTLATYGMSVASGHMSQPGSGVASNIPSACTHTFLVGLGSGDGAGIVQYLKQHTSAVVLLSFDDVTKYYSSLQASVGGQSSSVTDRLLFATNLPSWTATPSDPTAAAASAPLGTVTQFLQSVPDSMHTPAAVRAFIVAMMYDMLSAGQGPDPDVQQQLYDASTIVMDGMLFGYFSTDCYRVSSLASATCVGNAGATSIAVWSYTRVVTPSTPLRVAGVVPTMIYDSPVTAQVLSSTPHNEVGSFSFDVNMSDSSCVHYEEVSSAMSRMSRSSNHSSSSRPVLSSSSSFLIRSSNHNVDVNDLIIFLVGSLILVALILVVMLLWKFGIIVPVVKRVNTCVIRCSTLFTRKATIQHHQHVDEYGFLEQQTTDASRCDAVVSGESVTVVFVEVEHWRPLWVRVPDVMRHVVSEYHHCVRHAMLRHGCVELRCVAGVLVVVCPTAAVGVQLVQDIHGGLRAMSATLRASLAAAYVSLGVVADEHDGDALRVRVGVDTSSGVAAGTVSCTDGCVEVATRASYRNSTCAGLCVVTERTRSALSEEELTSMDLCLVSAGFHALHYGSVDAVLEMFVLCTTDTMEVRLSSSPMNERLCEYALEMLRSGVEVAVKGVPSVRCASTFGTFYCAVVPERVQRLESVLQLFALPAVRQSAYADESAYCDALVCAVSHRLAALLECRHGYIPGQLRSRFGVGAACVGGVHREGSLLADGECGDATQALSVSRSCKAREHRRSYLRRFAYSRED